MQLRIKTVCIVQLSFNNILLTVACAVQ